MTTHFDFFSGTSLASGWPVLADAAVKSLVVLAGAWAATRAMRRASAAMRHLIWALAVSATLAVPMLSGFLPQWRILPAWAGQESAATTPVARPGPALAPSLPAARVDAEPRNRSLPEGMTGHPALSAEPAGAPTAAAARTQAEVSASARASSVPQAPAVIQPAPKPWWMQIRWQSWVMIVWGCGTLVMMLPVIVSLLSLWRLGRRSARIEGAAWELLLRELAGRLHLRRAVKLLRSRRRAMPMTWGILRPKLLLPHDADGWSPQRRRVIIMHELAHIKRADFLVQLITHLARAIYWFNPLIWMASKQIAAEGEGACDDLVLSQETKASDYAEHLLTVAARLREGALIPVAAIAMARSSRLEGRLLAILDGKRNRRALTVAGIILAATLLVGGVLPLAMIRAADRQGGTKAATDAPASKASAGSAKSAATAPSAVEKDDPGNFINAPGSVAPYDRVPPEARGAQGPQPVPIVFSVPGDNVPEIVRKWDAHQSMAVDVYGRDFLKKLGHGSLVGIDNQIDATTGTLACKAVVLPVGDALLFPNQFVNVRLYLVSVKSPDTGPASSAESHRDVLQAELQQARAEAAEQGKRHDAGLVDPLTLQAAKNKVEILEAELTGDPIKVAEARLVAARRQLEITSRFWKAGMLPHLELDRAKGEVAVAEARLREAVAQAHLSDGMAPLKIELERVVRITGVVQDPDGNPVAGATVAPADGTGNSLTGDTSFSVATAKDGTFVIELPASGAAKYNLEAHDGNQAQWRKWANGVLPPIQTKPGDELKNVVIKLTRPATVRGHVKDETGKPLANREVRASAADKLENRYYDPTTTTDKNGDFELRFIRPGDQFIQAAPFFWCNVPEGGMTLKLKEGETNSLAVTLKEGEARVGVELTAPASTKFPSHEEQLRRAIERMEHPATQPKAKGADAAPPKKAADRATKLKADIRNFKLDLQYNGAQDKPYYRLRLSVAPFAAKVGANPFDLQTQITEDQARKIIDHLAAEGFLDAAYSLEEWGFIPKASEPGYSLLVSSLMEQGYYSDLGWKLPMLTRLDGLRSVLEGDAAKSMDLLLGRLNGERKQWAPRGPDALEKTPANHPDLANLKGEWKVTSIKGGGSYAWRQIGVGDTIAINRVDVQPPRAFSNLHDNYVISPLETPKRLDVTVWVKDMFLTQCGIYQLDGDTLTLCMAPHQLARPANFALEGDHSTLFVLKRAIPAKVVRPPGDRADAAPARSVNLSGHVVDDATGKPVSNFSVQGGHANEKNPAEITWGYWLETRGSNPNGEFSGNLDWSAGWRSRIVASGYVSQPILTELPSDDAVEITDIVVRLKRGRTVSGHVFDHAGNPVRDAGVYVAGNPSINLTGGKAMELAGGFVEDTKAIRVATDAQGAFTVTGIGQDSEGIAVTSSALDLWLVPIPRGNAAGENLEIHLPQPGKLIVHYDIAGAPDKTRLFMQLHTWDIPGWASVQCNRYEPIQQHTEFALEALPPGMYTIDRCKNNGLKNTADETFLDRRRIKIESGKTVVVDFVRPRGAAITGQVIGLDQGEVASAKPTRVYVRVHPLKEDRWLPVIFDCVAMEPGDRPMDGKFTTERIPPGQYKVRAEVFIPETEEQRHSTGIVPPAFEGEVLVTVPEQGPPEPVKIQLAPFKFSPPDPAPPK